MGSLSIADTAQGLRPGSWHGWGRASLLGNPARVAEGRGSPGAFFMRVLSPFHDLVTSMLSL